MSWQNILKHKKKITPLFKEMIESVVTDTPKSGKQILDMLHDEVDKTNSTRGKRYLISKKYLPTARELSGFFRANKNKYGMKILNGKGKEVQKESGNTTRYYYKL